MEEVDGVLDLWCKFVPELDRKVNIDRAKGTDESGVVATRMLLVGALAMTKIEVAPVSAMTWVFDAHGIGMV